MVTIKQPVGVGWWEIRLLLDDGFPHVKESHSRRKDYQDLWGPPNRCPYTRQLSVRGTVIAMTTDQPASSDQAPGSSLEDHIDAREVELVDLADVSAQEIIFRSIVVLMSAAAEKLGLADDEPTGSPHLDLDEARKLVTALAGLVAGSAEYLGPQAGVVRDGLQGLQHAFREASAYPDKPGEGPGEKFTGPVY